jgi:hypothetical protein
MTKNIDQNEGSKFRTIENDGFGASKVKELAVGDLVEWDSWEYNLVDEYFYTKNGLLVEIIKDKRVSGWVYMAKIKPFGDEKEVEIPLISIRKMAGTD